MREAIHKFGRVDSNGLPLETSAFADPTSPSTCLPQVFEDYEDAEHHVLYKPVSGDYSNVSLLLYFENYFTLAQVDVVV